MGLLVQLSDLRTQVRQRADEVSDGVNPDPITTQEVNSYINAAASDYHNFLIQCWGENYFVKVAPLVTTVAGLDLYPFSSFGSDVLKITALDLWNDTTGVNVFNIRRLMNDERNAFNGFLPIAWNTIGYTNVRYEQEAQAVRLFPRPVPGGIFISLRYVPVYTILVNDTDTIDTQNFWGNEYIICKCVSYICAKKESMEQAAYWLAAADKQRQFIQEMAINRDLSEGFRIPDVTTRRIGGGSIWGGNY